MLRQLLFDIGKIVEGAANGDAQMIAVYTRHMSEKLEAAGEAEAAKRLRNIVAGGKLSRIGLAKMGATGSPSLPVDSESRLPVADESVHAKGSVPLFVAEDARKMVEQFLAFYRASDELFAKGVGISPSMLVYGPPGCGKTQLAKYIASEAGLPLLTARSDSLISSFLGSTAKNVRSLFTHANSRPCVLFLDEFDSLAKMRDDDRELGELKRVVISLLQNIDAMGKDHILIAATNHPHLLDPAAWRRFAYRVELVEPTAEARSAMAQAFLGSFATQESVEALVVLNAGSNGAQIRQTADDSIRTAILAKRERVSLTDVITASVANHPETRGVLKLSLADRLKAVRRISPKFFTQARLAEYAGVSQPMISKLLRGDN